MDKYKVVLNQTFLSDLEAVVSYIAKDNATAAQKFGQEILDSAAALETFPARHSPHRFYPKVHGFVTRRHYKIFYRIDTDSKVVEVLRLWDARRGSRPSFSQP